MFIHFIEEVMRPEESDAFHSLRQARLRADRLQWRILKFILAWNLTIVTANIFSPYSIKIWELLTGPINFILTAAAIITVLVLQIRKWNRKRIMSAIEKKANERISQIWDLNTDDWFSSEEGEELYGNFVEQFLPPGDNADPYEIEAVELHECPERPNLFMFTLWIEDEDATGDDEDLVVAEHILVFAGEKKEYRRFDEWGDLIEQKGGDCRAINCLRMLRQFIHENIVQEQLATNM